MKKWKIRHPVLVCAVCFLLLRADSTGIFRLTWLSAFLHECGHIAVWLFLTGKQPSVEISVTGICLDRKGQWLSREKELLLAMAGPAANLLLAAMCILYNEYVRASYRGYYFACVNLLLGTFNLLPVAPLDGKYLFTFLREKLQSGRK